MSERFGRYQLLVELGRGGMAEVFLAVNDPTPGEAVPSNSKPLVIKRLHPHLAEDPDFVTMFMDEARLAGRVQHPNVVEAHEVGQVGENYFIAMEFLDGQPLRRIQWRAQKQGLPFQELGYAVIVEALSGLHHAHELIDDDGTKLSVVHRDVTPHNIFVTYDGHVKVVDFGIAKAERRAQETRHGVVKGKVRYMAPEQTTGRPLDRRVDIFAAGVILWEVAARQRLWDGVPDQDVVRRIATNDIPRHPREVNPAVTPAIDEICARALSYEPDDRYSSALEMRRALEQAVGEESLRAARATLGPTIMQLFQSDRDKLNAILDRQLAKLPHSLSTSLPPESSGDDTTGTTLVRADSKRPREATEVLPLAPRSSDPLPRPNDSASHAARLPDPSSASMPVVTATGDGSERTPALSVPWESPRRRQARVIAVIAAVPLVVTTVLLVARLQAPSFSGSASPSAQGPSVESTNVMLTATPATARFWIDDAPIPSNPYQGQVPRDDRQHSIRIEAPNYEPETWTVDFAISVVLSIDLKPQASTAPAERPSATPSRPPTNTGKPQRPSPLTPPISGRR